MTRVSRMYYVYGNYTDLWRDLTLLYCQQYKLPLHYHQTWRDTLQHLYLSLHHKSIDAYIPHIPMAIPNIYSTALYRAWACCSYDINLSFPKFYSNNNIPIIDTQTMTYEAFIDLYESKNAPVVLTNLISNWPALHKWTDEYLSEVSSSKPFRATSAMASSSASFTMGQYIQYARFCHEEVPLYLFERNFASHEHLRRDFCVPDYFDANKHPHTDLFRLFGPQARPDYRWLIVGPAKSGSIFHIDPNFTNAWNAVIRGRKKWIFYPPHVSPPVRTLLHTIYTTCSLHAMAMMKLIGKDFDSESFCGLTLG